MLVTVLAASIAIAQVLVVQVREGKERCARG